MGKRWTLIAVASLVLLLVGAAGASLYGGGSVIEDIEVKPHPLALPDQESTVALARLPQGSLILRAVTEAEVEGVFVPLTPLEAYGEHGISGLMALRESGEPTRASLQALLPPVDSAPPHLGAGNNFSAHQEEVGLEALPGLFPKMSAPTAWNADVPSAARLDYEVELCAVALDTLTPSTPPTLGFVLCNDFTDRWTMVATLKPSAPPGTTGVPDGKGGPGRLPVGPWLVIPSDAAAFGLSVTLRLSVDGRQRQRSAQSLAVWDHHRIVKEAFEACALDYRYHGEAVAWPACGEIPRGTLILGGTPAGVVFRLQTLWAGWRYLQTGSLVITEGTGLGRLSNRIVEG